MKALWNDIRQHPRSAVLFAVTWLSLIAYTFASWGRGMSDVAYLIHWVSPIIAGALVGWWRFPIREGLLVGRTRFAPAPLAGVLVVLCTVTVVLAREAAVALFSGRFNAAGTGDFITAWFFASVIFGLIASVLGLFGGWLSVFVRAFGKSAPRQT
ncbi:MAG TPA: hypothetical protein VFL80_06240 [Thermoanaerobaculia bacterium]|nr:hypothetical protein [Thermoanaerobaculia bacterium]